MFWLAKFISTVYLFAYLLFLLFLFLPIEELKLFKKKGRQMRKSAVIKINSKKSSPKMEP